MKASELTGALLDFWVAKAEGGTFNFNGEKVTGWAFGEPYQFSPSTNWAQGGPILERELFDLEWDADGYWCAHMPNSWTFRGETMLIAAMRAYVASKFGDEVPDEIHQAIDNPQHPA